MTGYRVGDPLITRQYALTHGLLTYTGDPCPKGHIERYVSCYTCVECIKEATRKRRNSKTRRKIIRHKLKVDLPKEIANQNSSIGWLG